MENIIKKDKNYTYEILKNDIQFLKNEYPYMYIGDIGQSTLGEKIKYIKLGNGPKKVFINASHHANEWLTSLTIMLFTENYLRLYKQKQYYKGYNIEELWNKSSIYIVPMVNPDGVNLCLKDEIVIQEEFYKPIWKAYERRLYRWKSNIRGVDLNLNYPAGFEQARKNKFKKGIYKPGPRDYVGPNALSEVETRNLYKFTKLFQFDITISLHSQGEEIYWSYQDIKLPEAYELGKVFAKVSGYKLTQPEYNSSFAGYKDWFISEFKKPGFTIEIGKGREGLPLPLEDVNDILDKIEEIFLISAS